MSRANKKQKKEILEVMDKIIEATQETRDSIAALDVKNPEFDELATVKLMKYAQKSKEIADE